MLLSTQLFDRIVGIAAAGISDPQRKSTVLPAGCRRAAERRQTSRMAFGHRSQICLDGGPRAGVWATVMLQDISLKGIGCLSHDPMDAGQTFVVKLTDKEGETIRIRCKVRRCETGGFGSTAFLVGATFEHVIQQQVIRLTDVDEADGPQWNQDRQCTPASAVAVGETTGLKTALGRAAVCLLKAVDPSQWLRRSDDFSSRG